jgi:hypothetical protein
MKKTSLLVLVTCLLFTFTLTGPGVIRAQGSPVVLSQSIESEFPLNLKFNLSAASDADITDIRLFYEIQRESFAQVTSEIYIDFLPNTTVDVSSTLNMIKTGGLPPGTGLTYRWELQDADGNKLEPDPVQIQFDDNRYSWQKFTQGKLTFYWYDGDQSFAEQLMAAAQQALVRLAGETGAFLNQPVKIYIYSNAQDLQGALIYPKEWTGGVTFADYGVIAIGISPGSLDWGERTISHELTHMVNHQMTSNPYSGLPTWLDEGLAKFNEGPIEQGDLDILNKAIVQKSLVSLRSICSGFSAYPNLASLSYVEGWSAVDFLIHNYGEAKMLELLNTIKQGRGYDEAFNKVYGFDIDGLNSEWQDHLSKNPPTAMHAGQVRVLVSSAS